MFRLLVCVAYAGKYTENIQIRTTKFIVKLRLVDEESTIRFTETKKVFSQLMKKENKKMIVLSRFTKKNGKISTHA